MSEFAEENLKKVREADFYGIQLDHWTSRHSENVLVVMASWITKSWTQNVQIIEFKTVPNTTAEVTAIPVKSVLERVGLDPAKCVGYQSDNCSAMIKSNKIFKDITQLEPESDDEGDAFTFEVEGYLEDERPLSRDLREFVGCGAHRLNNAITDTILDFQFFRQLNSFCLKVGGPTLSNTRWYGALRQIEFAVKIKEVLENERNSNQRSFGLLDPLLVNHMENLHEKLAYLGKFFETEYPVADYIVSQVRKITAFSDKLSNCDAIHQTVRNFASNLHSRMNIDRRFGAFPGIILGAALLNPEKKCRDMLSVDKKRVAKEPIVSFPNSSVFEAEIDTSSFSTGSVSSRNAVDDIFESLGFLQTSGLSKNTAYVENSISDELDEYLHSTDISKSAFGFFKEDDKWPKLKQAARALLAVLLSPANAERCFSRASFLTENRRNRLSVKNIRIRLLAT